MKAFQAHLTRFRALDTQVLGVSHNSSKSQAQFAAKLGLEFPLLSDPKGSVARVYGAKGWLPLFKRRAVVIDGRGVIRMIVDGMPQMDELLTFLGGLRGDLPESRPK